VSMHIREREAMLQNVRYKVKPSSARSGFDGLGTRFRDPVVKNTHCWGGALSASVYNTPSSLGSGEIPVRTFFVFPLCWDG
jgi:hypothetical protein